MKNHLNVNGDIHLVAKEDLNQAEVATLSARRIPIVSVHDGEPGLLDNLGSIVGVKHESLAVRKHSKCGTPEDIYGYHGIDHRGVVKACGKVLSETALEDVRVSKEVLKALKSPDDLKNQENWENLWPKTPQIRH